MEPQYLIVLALCLVVAVQLYGRLGAKGKLPPGPSGIPILGNLVQVIQAKESKAGISQWLQSLSRYGDFTTLRMGAETWVLINSSRVANEIINKRASITNERPPFPIANDRVSQNARVVLRQTAQWRDARKVMHPLLNGVSLKAYTPLLDQESVRLLGHYLERPKLWYFHDFQYGYQTVHQIVAGKNSGHSDKQLQEFQRVTMDFLKYINANIVDYFPFLDKIPKYLQPWRPYWNSIGSDHRAVLDSWCEPVRRSIKDGSAPDSFVKSLLLEHPKFSTDIQEAMHIATSIIEAGSDNVRMGLNALMMVAMDQPKPTAKAREEIDRLCGGSEPSRLPNLDDMQRLPYVNAMIKESLRWRPNIPIAIIPQHRLTQDLHFEGYEFPAGVDFLVNTAAVSRECEDPETYLPERWLTEDQTSNHFISGLWSFGGGHRICVGYNIAQQALFLAFSRLIFCFDFESAGAYDNWKMRHEYSGEPFPVKATIRSQKHADLIKKLVSEL